MINEHLQEDIYSLIKGAVSATTEHVYYLLLPSEELLQVLTITYEINNTGNEDTFDSTEAEKTYRLRIKINAPAPDLIGDNSIYIKNKIYRLKAINTRVNYVKLEAEETFYDHEYKVFTSYLSYELKYS